jgi:hypothetical protein
LTGRWPSGSPVSANWQRKQGLPFLVDPLTPLLQVTLPASDSWAGLPYASQEEVAARALLDRSRLRDLAIDVVEYQLEQRATAIIPLYLAAQDPADPAFEVSLQALHETARYLEYRHPGIPLLPLLCGKEQAFGTQTKWRDGIDRFAAAAKAAGADSAAAFPHSRGRAER